MLQNLFVYRRINIMLDFYRKSDNIKKIVPKSNDLKKTNTILYKHKKTSPIRFIKQLLNHLICFCSVVQKDINKNELSLRLPNQQ